MCQVASRRWACNRDSNEPGYESMADLQVIQIQNYEPSRESRVNLQLGYNKLQAQLRVKDGPATRMENKTRVELRVKVGLAIEKKQITA